LNSRQVRVIDREKVQQAAQSQNANGRQPSAQEAAALGLSLGADAVIVGSVQAPDAPGSFGVGSRALQRKAAQNVSVRADIIDTRKAKPMGTMVASGASLQVATNSLGNKIQSTLAKGAEGLVTRLNGDVVSVAFTGPHSLQTGSRCDIIRGERKIGELLITSVNGQYAFGTFFGTGKPRVGDRVTSF
jgi:hypothetical protein